MKSAGKRTYKISKWIHKYPGLLLLLFLAWMSVSGVLLNHKDLLKNFSVPGCLVPANYHPDNWNRSTMKGIVANDSLGYFVFGNQGVYLTKDEGKSFSPFMGGTFPKAVWKRRTNHLLYHENSKQLLAATNKGLFACKPDSANWKEVLLPENDEPVKKILQHEAKITVLTESAVYSSNNAVDFTRNLPKKEQIEERIALFLVFFELHDGSIWGLPGKLLWDLAGIILFFLCFSAFYIWFYPKKWKRRHKRRQIKSSRKEKKRFGFYFKYHKKLGWYFGILLLIIFITGIFLRPPLLISIAGKSVNKKYYPSIEHANPWHNKINNALYDSKNGRIVLECTDGLWAGNPENNEPFKKLKLPIRIFAMGATVFEEEAPGKWLIGSFGGLQRFSLSDNTSGSLLHLPPSSHPGRPANLLVTGQVQLPDGNRYALGHYKGLCNLKGNPAPHVWPMPESIAENYRMPLWNFLFELHNARIFRGLADDFYILIIPLFGLLGIFVLLSGIFDYWYVKLRRRK